MSHREREEGREKKGNIGARDKCSRDTRNQNVFLPPYPPGTKGKTPKLEGAGPTPNPTKVNPPTPEYPGPPTTPKRKQVDFLGKGPREKKKSRKPKKPHPTGKGEKGKSEKKGKGELTKSQITLSTSRRPKSERLRKLKVRQLTKTAENRE